MKWLLLPLKISLILILVPLWTFGLEVRYPDFIPLDKVTTLPELVRFVFQFALSVAALLLFVALVRAGVTYLLSQGNPTHVKNARKDIGSAFMGAGLLLLSFLLVQYAAPELAILKRGDAPSLAELPPKFDQVQREHAAETTEFLKNIKNKRDKQILASQECAQTLKIQQSQEEIEKALRGEGDIKPENFSVTDSFPFVSTAQHSADLIESAHKGLAEIYALAQGPSLFTATSNCSTSPDDHGFDECHGGYTGPCGEAVGCHDTAGDSSHTVTTCGSSYECNCVDACDNATPPSCSTSCSTCQDCSDACITDSIGPSLPLHHHYTWWCHKSDGGGSHPSGPKLAPTLSISAEGIQNTIDRIEGKTGIVESLEKIYEEKTPGDSAIGGLVAIKSIVEDIRARASTCAYTPLYYMVRCELLPLVKILPQGDECKIQEDYVCVREIKQ